MGRAALIVAAGVLLSRVLGLVRDMVFAGVLGADQLTDEYVMAFAIPDWINYLLAGGFLTISNKCDVSVSIYKAQLGNLMLLRITRRLIREKEARQNHGQRLWIEQFDKVVAEESIAVGEPFIDTKR